jgi:hypothetical protein
MEGLLYLMKINDFISSKITQIDQSLVKELLAILQSDKERLVSEFNREA